MNNKQQKIAVAGFLAVDNKVLVVRRSSKENYFSGYYELPGGKIDFGEHPEQGLKREFFEETNLKITPLYLIRIFDYITNKGSRHTVELVYAVELNSDLNNLKLSDAHDDYKWISLNELDSFKISDEIKINIKEGFKRIKEYFF